MFSAFMTMSKRVYDAYGHDAIMSFLRHWPEEIKLRLYYDDDPLPNLIHDRVELIPFHDACPDQHLFVERNANRHEHVTDLEVNNITHQAAKFSYKVYAQLNELENPRTKYVVYLDADMMTCEDVPQGLLDNLTADDAFVSFLNRPAKYTETGFIIWNTEDPYREQWCKEYRAMYDEDKIFEYDAWHDCIAFDAVTLPKIKDGTIRGVDLSYGVKSNHPLVAGPLGKYFDHLKGPSRKVSGYSPERKRAGF